MKVGEVWRIRIPSSPGHMQTGDRPAIILQADRFIASLPTAFIIPFTSALAAARFDGTLLVQPNQQNGLRVPSLALVFQLRALDQRFCLQRLGVLDTTTLDQVYALLDQLTGR